MNDTFCFRDLFIKKIDLNKDTKVCVNRIVIPKIQRPYAQGRKDGVATYVRTSLVQEMLSTLSAGKICDFNFIYGILKDSGRGYDLELLDGQQRLTTLFLLHWYVVNRELKESDPLDTSVRDILHRFVYETRSTSSVFCQKLAGYHVDLGQDEPQTVIRRAKWYFKSFDKDSTICAMLTMLDEIHRQYSSMGLAGLASRLDNVRFYVKSLGYYNLSEELYIKMNARGLQLSPFECFKADLTNFISKSSYKGFSKDVPLFDAKAEEKVPFSQNFSIKLDAKWVDLFWKRGSEDFDASYMSFFSRFFACKYILSTQDTVSDQEMRFDPHLRALYTEAEARIDSNEYYGFKNFEDILSCHPEYIETLSNLLDILHGQSNEIFKEFVSVWDRTGSDSDDFICNIKSRMSQVKLILFAALMEYVDAFGESFSITMFRDWMRIVWNIIENTNIDSLTPTSGLIRKLSALIHSVKKAMDKGAVSLFSALSDWNNDQRENRAAVIEEVRKSKKIADDPLWLEVFKKAEKHEFFRGMVLFFYDDSMTIDDYTSAITRIGNLFDKDGIAPEYRKDHLLIRAMVSRYTSWGEIQNRYITERVETNKYLKILITSNPAVPLMFASLARLSSDEEIKAKLNEFISSASPMASWDDSVENNERMKRVGDLLRNDIKLYDMIATRDHGKDCFRVYWFIDHILCAIPRAWYDKIVLDTNRDSISVSLCANDGFEFQKKSQFEDIKAFGHCFENDVWLTRKDGDLVYWIGFCLNHELKIQVECPDPDVASTLLQKFSDGKIVGEQKRWIERSTTLRNDLRVQLNDIEDVLNETVRIIHTPDISN